MRTGILLRADIWVNIMKEINMSDRGHHSRPEGGRPASSKGSEKTKPTGKRVGKSKPEKANNQLNRRVK